MYAEWLRRRDLKRQKPQNIPRSPRNSSTRVMMAVHGLHPGQFAQKTALAVQRSLTTHAMLRIKWTEKSIQRGRRSLSRGASVYNTRPHPRLCIAPTIVSLPHVQSEDRIVLLHSHFEFPFVVSLGQPPREPVGADPRPLVQVERVSEERVRRTPATRVRSLKELGRPAAPRPGGAQRIYEPLRLSAVEAVCQKGTLTLGA